MGGARLWVGGCISYRADSCMYIYRPASMLIENKPKTERTDEIQGTPVAVQRRTYGFDQWERSVGRSG